MLHPARFYIVELEPKCDSTMEERICSVYSIFLVESATPNNKTADIVIK